MEPLFSDFDHGMPHGNPKDFEEMMNKTLELGTLSSQTMRSTLQLPDLEECRDSDSGQHATNLEKLEASPYFPPPSPVSPVASLLALNFDSKDGPDRSAHQEEQSDGSTNPVQNRINMNYPVQPNALGQFSRSHEEVGIGDYGEPCKPRSIGAREAPEPLDVKNRMTSTPELRNYGTEYVNPQMCSVSYIVAPDNSCDKLLPGIRSHQKSLTQQLVSKRDVLDYEHTKHGLQELLQLLSEPSDPPRKKPRAGHRLAPVGEPRIGGQLIDTQAMSKTVTTPRVFAGVAKEVIAKQGNAVLKSQPLNDAWTDLLQLGENDDMIYNPPAPGELQNHLPECMSATLQPDPVTEPLMPATDGEPKLRFSPPLDDAWFLHHNPTISANSPSLQRLEPSNDTGIVDSSNVIPKHGTKISDSPKQPRSVLPQPGSQIEILYPRALGNISPKAVRTLLRASGDDIVSKIELYWSHFHDYRVSTERAARLLREKSVRFERRKRMGPEVPAIEKKAIRAQRNRERSQALRRYHKQRMGDLEAASGQLKLYNSVAKSFINCLLEEPQSLGLVREYFTSHECSEELLTYLRGSI
ncbi:hypothetical protein FGB62_127g021 [Gracilaria domingensis]|nr:hypothetical protein FGB62_127g021 [Gracilaria domingensis]